MFPWKMPKSALLNSKESSSANKQSDFPVLSKKPFCQGDHCCCAPSLALTYTLQAAWRDWDLWVSSCLGFVGRWQLSLPDRHQASGMGPQNWLVICFSISALPLNPSPLLIKTNVHSLTSRCFCWLNAHHSKCSQGRAGAVCKLGSKEGFPCRVLSSAATI